MKRLSLILSLLVLVVLAASPFAALAQEDEEIELVEYVDPNGYFTIAVPEDWIVEFDAEGAIYVANSEEALEVIKSNESEELVLQTDQFGMGFYFYPTDLLGSIGLDTAAMTPEELVQEFIALVAEGGDADDPTVPVFGDAVELVIDEETSIYGTYMTMEAFNLEGLFLFFPATEDLYVLATVGAMPGEFADFEALVPAIVSTLEVNFTAEDLMTGLEVDDPMATEEPGS